MRPPFSLLILHGDGSSVLRVRVPRWIVYGVLGVLSSVVGTAVSLLDDYVVLKRDSDAVVALRRGAGDRRDLGQALQRELASVRGEITAWRALHARMWEALDRGAGSNVGANGLGGPAPRAAAADVGPNPWEELDSLAASVAEEGPHVRELERVISHAGALVAQLPLRWPVRGAVNSEYGRRRSPWTGAPVWHEGIDIGTSSGTPVESPAAGRVIAASLGPAYGKYVLLDHGNGVRSRYGHLQELDVRPGDRVEKGQVIGLVGLTGRSTGPHLHYEVLVEGKPVDPRRFLWD